MRLRERVDGLLERLRVVRGVRAQLVLDARPELGEHVVGDVLGRLRDEEDTHTLRPDETHGLGDGVQEVLGRVREQQVRLVEEEDQLGLVDVADLGQVVEQVGEQPHQEGREDRRPVDQVGQFEERHDPASIGGDAQEIAGVELGLAEEVVGPLVGQPDEFPQDHPDRRGRQAADRLEFGLSLVAGEMHQDGPQVGEVEQGQAGLVGVVEDQAERRLLGVVESEHLAQEHRAEARHRRPQRHPHALRAEGEELGRAPQRRPRLADLLRPRRQLLAHHTRGRQTRQVTLDVCSEDRDAGRRDLLRHQLQGLRLAGARRAGHQPVTVEHRQRDADLRVHHRCVILHEDAELDGGLVKGVAAGDLVDGVGRRFSHGPSVAQACRPEPVPRMIAATGILAAGKLAA